jgi:hypothetical protein
VRGDVVRALHRFLNPLVGGPNWMTPDGADSRSSSGNQDPFARGPWAPRADAEAGWSRGRELSEPGWPFGYPLRLVEIRAVVQTVPGVRLLESIRVYYRRGESENRVQLRGEQVELPNDMLVVSEQHVVNVSE